MQADCKMNPENIQSSNNLPITGMYGSNMQKCNIFFVNRISCLDGQARANVF